MRYDDDILELLDLEPEPATPPEDCKQGPSAGGWELEIVVRMLTESAPCDGCELAKRCKTGRACAAFARYIHAKPWADVPREPTRRIYGRIYRTEERPRRQRARPASRPARRVESRCAA